MSFNNVAVTLEKHTSECVDVVVVGLVLRSSSFVKLDFYYYLIHKKNPWMMGQERPQCTSCKHTHTYTPLKRMNVAYVCM